MDITQALEILGLPATATPSQIKEAYRDLAKVWHPDRFGSDPRLRAKADETLKRINEAYQVLQGHSTGRSPGSARTSAPGRGSSSTYRSQTTYQAGSERQSGAAAPPSDAAPSSRGSVPYWVYGVIVVAVVGLIRYSFIQPRTGGQVNLPSASRISETSQPQRTAVSTPPPRTTGADKQYTLQEFAGLLRAKNPNANASHLPDEALVARFLGQKPEYRKYITNPPDASLYVKKQYTVEEFAGILRQKNPAKGTSLTNQALVDEFIKQKPGYSVYLKIPESQTISEAPAAQNRSPINSPGAGAAESKNSDLSASRSFSPSADNKAASESRPRAPSESPTNLAPEEKASLEAACSQAKYLEGPTSYNRCIEDHLARLASAPRRPDLSNLSEPERQSIEAACSQSKYLEGPAAYNRCLRAQLARLATAPKRPDLSDLTAPERQSIEAACSQAKYLEGPAAYNGCLIGQLALLKGRR